MPNSPAAGLRPRASRARTIAAYTAMTGACFAAFFWIRTAGERLSGGAATAAAPAAPAAPGEGHVLAEVLLAVAVITIMARVVGRAVEKYLRQPPVMGEILSGIILGPSVLGAISAGAHTFLMPPEAAPYLGIVAKIGVVLFMFLVGLHMDAGPLRSHTHTTLAISHASMFAPFILGATLALAVFPLYGTAGTSFTVFSLFLGVSMSVTAFPVLARILIDRRIQHTPVGATALACAAVGDATAWCLLAVISGVATAQLGNAATTVALAALYVALMFTAVRPLVRWLAAREERSAGPVSPTVLAIVMGLMLFSAVATEAIGIHALFGAFLFGALIPHDGRLAGQIRTRSEDLVAVLLLPIFFAFTGMRTEIGLLASPVDWLFCGVIILVATAGKFGGSFVAARLSGLGWRESGAIGALMNTRGLMELIVLNVGLDMGILSPTLFAMLVIMALATTFSTTPMLHAIMGRRGLADAPAAVPATHDPIATSDR